MTEYDQRLGFARELRESDRREDAINALDAIVDELAERSDVDSRALRVRALRGKAATLNDLGRVEEELTLYDRVLET